MAEKKYIIIRETISCLGCGREFTDKMGGYVLGEKGFYFCSTCYDYPRKFYVKLVPEHCPICHSAWDEFGECPQGHTPDEL